MWVPGRDQVSPAAGKICAKAVYAKADQGSLERHQTAEICVPFCSGDVAREPGFAAEGGGWKVVDRGDQKFGRTSINPSGGVLCTNPIGASISPRRGRAAGDGPRGRTRSMASRARSGTRTAAHHNISRCGSSLRSFEMSELWFSTRRRTASRSSR
jgi:hypothetical protein